MPCPVFSLAVDLLAAPKPRRTKSHSKVTKSDFWGSPPSNGNPKTNPQKVTFLPEKFRVKQSLLGLLWGKPRKSLFSHFGRGPHLRPVTARPVIRMFRNFHVLAVRSFRISAFSSSDLHFFVSCGRRETLHFPHFRLERPALLILTSIGCNGLSDFQCFGISGASSWPAASQQ